jgi:hypothetical protein
VSLLGRLLSRFTRPYPRINIEVCGASLHTVCLTIEVSRWSGLYVGYFDSVEEAEAKAREIIDSLELATVANKRIKEIVNGS